MRQHRPIGYPFLKWALFVTMTVSVISFLFAYTGNLPHSIIKPCFVVSIVAFLWAGARLNDMNIKS